MPASTSPEIIRKAKGGDLTAFRIIVEENQAFAYSLAYRFVRHEEEAEDIVQEAFVRLWKNLPAYREEIKLSTWLYRIVANRCLDYLKSRRAKEKGNQTDAERAEHVRDGATPETQYDQEELIRAVHQAAEHLTPRQKAVFILRDLEGLTTEEVTEVLQIAAGNIKSNLYYARQKIAEQLRKIYQTSDQPFIS